MGLTFEVYVHVNGEGKCNLFKNKNKPEKNSDLCRGFIRTPERYATPHQPPRHSNTAWTLTLISEVLSPERFVRPHRHVSSLPTATHWTFYPGCPEGSSHPWALLPVASQQRPYALITETPNLGVTRVRHIQPDRILLTHRLDTLTRAILIPERFVKPHQHVTLRPTVRTGHIPSFPGGFVTPCEPLRLESRKRPSRFTRNP